MGKPLQDFDWKNSDYERPSSDWVCGLLCHGETCKRGPTSKGECRQNNCCIPEQSGDHFECTRGPVDGGKCIEGPTPDGTCCQSDTKCQPDRSLLANRRRVGMICLLITLSFSLIALSKSASSPLMYPGDVIAAHAVFEFNCEKCHVQGEQDLSTWVVKSMSQEQDIDDSKKCMVCHTELGKDALNPHGTSTLVLTTSQRRILQAFNKDKTTSPDKLASDLDVDQSLITQQIACITCHKEHNGRTFDLTQISNYECQTCHVEQFSSFNHGHPDLGQYPYHRRTQIYFDHGTHLLKYFAQDEFKRLMPTGVAPESCSACHQLAPSGNLMLTKNFDAACAKCHIDEIEDPGFPGIAFLNLPDFSAKMFEFKKGMKTENPLGEWPISNGKFSTPKLPPFMELLLTADPLYVAAVKQIKEIDYRQLDDFDSNQKKALLTIAWSIKQLFYDISQNGSEELKKRLGPQASNYVNLKPSIIPAVMQAQKLWFPNLDNEMRTRQKNSLVNSSAKVLPKTPSSQNDIIRRNNDWYLADHDHSIRYRPHGHADPLLKSWIDATVQSSSLPTKDRNAKQDTLDRLFRILLNPSASGTVDTKGPVSSGRCLQCHTVDKNPETNNLHVNWKIKNPTHPQNEFTFFSHASHILTTTGETCKTCHDINQKRDLESDYLRPEFFRREASNFEWVNNTNAQQTCTSGFSPIRKQACIKCHNDNLVGQNCHQCHKYHVNDIFRIGH